MESERPTSRNFSLLRSSFFVLGVDNLSSYTYNWHSTDMSASNSRREKYLKS